MRSRRLIQVLAAVAVAVSLVAGAPSAAFGKGEIRTRLTAPIPSEASPGETITVSWKAYGLDGADEPVPFNATGFFVRLKSASGGAAAMGFASPDAHLFGRYEARVTVPDGGIGGVEIGWRKPGRRAEVFPLVNDPFAGRAAEPVAPASEAASGGSFPTLLVLASGLAISITAVLGFMARRMRWSNTRQPRT